MRHLINHVVRCSLLSLALCLAACGLSSGGSTASTPGGNGTTVTSPTQTHGTPLPDSVTLLLDKTTYTLGDTVSITIVNKVATPITALDHQSACTIATVQIQRNGTWADVGKCLQGRPTRRITLDANTQTSIAIAPAATNLATNAQWQAGMYRIAFTYIPGKDEVTGPATIVYSATFTVS